MNTPPRWIGHALVGFGMLGMVLLVNPTAGAICALVVMGTAGLLLFCVVVAGKFDEPEDDFSNSSDSSSSSASQPHTPEPEGTRRPAEPNSEG